MASLPSPSQLDAMSTFDPEIEAMLKKLPLPEWNATEPEEAIREMRARYSQFPLPPPRADVEEPASSYRTRDGTELRLVLYKPASASEKLPVIVWFHGGGGCMGWPELNCRMHREYAAQHRCIVVTPEYRLGPEFKWPIGQQDGWDALEHVASQASKFGGDPTLGFIVGGESAGAVMSAILVLEAKEKALNPALTGAFLAAGSYFNPDDVPKEYQNHYRSRNDPVCKASPLLSEVSKRAFNACLAPDYTSRMYRAALWPDHQGLPKAYVQTCGLDINRDDGILYRDLLRRNGVETRLDVYDGCPHCFWFAFGESRMGRKWRQDSLDAIGWLLIRES